MPFGFELTKCLTCQGPFVDGSDVEREAAVDGITCRIKGIPTRRCAAGCAGTYWYRIDFGVEIFDAWAGYKDRVAKRPWFAFKPRHLCPLCDSALGDIGKNETFEFSAPLRKGTQSLVSLTAPAMKCPSCQKLFLPALLSQHDPFYAKLNAAIDAALTKDLIRE